MAEHLVGRPGSATPGEGRPVPWKVVGALALAQLGLFIGVLAPVTVSMAIKMQTLFPGSAKASASSLAAVLSVGAVVAMLGSPAFGRISDRTTSRFGRRRPWLLGGALAFLAGLAGVAWGPSVPVVLVSWAFCQLCVSCSFAALMAVMADLVPVAQRGKVSGVLGAMANAAPLGGAYLAPLFADDMALLFLVPGAIAALSVLVCVVVLPDPQVATAPPRPGLAYFVRSFWVSPRRHPDFALVWLGRFLITLASFMFITFRLYFLQDQLNMSAQKASSVLANGVLVYTAGLMAASYAGGRLSDRLGRRRVFVALATVLFAAGLVALAAVSTIGQFYAVEAIMGVAFGVYVGVDMALIIDVLPDPEETAKDLGVFNIANALPQSLASGAGLFLLTLGASGGSDNYPALFWGAGLIAAVGAVLVMFVRSVR
ncbi:MFS transporter [Streptomyces winkii]|uniref:MFS transporter n=1 Tax=Streptomyces winkii TaxID=3051178 RepID=UPI0028D4FE30|nr:MFS transporter [Streptomyces sp. DSM 40971]